MLIDTSSLGESTQLVQFINSVSNNPTVSVQSDVLVNRADNKSRTLNVIIRTQGNRDEKLKEVLLCLSGQKSDDFNITIVCHKASSADVKSLINSLPYQPKSIRDRISLIVVNEGGRSHPLNVGLSYTDSPYFALLDDDDIVFDNWVSSFIEGIQSHPGKLIHSGVYTQKWISRFTEKGCEMMSTEWPKATYCCSFNSIRQLVENRCPIMSIAFPFTLYSIFKMKFDESLTTLEDWDFIERASQICGVFDTGNSTSIYRIWESNEITSRSLHAKDEWEVNRVYVQKKLFKSPLMIPGEQAEVITSNLWMDTPLPLPSSEVTADLHFSDFKYEPIKQIDIEYDPAALVNTITIRDIDRNAESIIIRLRESGLYRITDFIAELHQEDCVKSCNVYQVNTNGYCQSQNTISFLTRRSWIEIPFDSNNITSEIILKFKYENAVDERLLTGTKLIVKFKQGLHRRIERKRFFL